jgi:hypothetical protein
MQTPPKIFRKTKQEKSKIQRFLLFLNSQIIFSYFAEKEEKN